MKSLSLIKHYPYSEVAAFYREESDSRRKQRLLAILLLYEGKKIPEVAQLVHVHATNIRMWVHQWNERAILGLFLKKGAGRPRKLSSAEEAQVVNAVDDSPTKSGYDTEQWSLKAIQNYIDTRLKKK
jgi:transposase